MGRQRTPRARSTARGATSVAFLHCGVAYGAIENYVAAIAKGMRRRGLSTTLVYPDAPELEPFETLANDSTRLAPYPTEYLSGNPLVAIWRLARHLRSLRVQTVHVTDVSSIGMLAAALAHPDQRLVTYHTPSLPRGDSTLGRALWRAAWATKPAVIYTSDADRAADGRSLVSHVVPYGIDLDRFDLPREPAGIVGTIARVAPQKDHRALIDAAPIVLERHPGIRFVVAGEGEIRPELERRAQELELGDRFCFLGHRTDVAELLSTFDVFALPSHYEGLCMAVIEAQAAGVPVVATPVGGVRENVVPGETGVVCAIGDPRSLAAGITALLDDPEMAARLASEARRRVRRRNGLEQMIAATIALYEGQPDHREESPVS